MIINIEPAFQSTKPKTTKSSYGVSKGLLKLGPQSIDNLGQAI